MPSESNWPKAAENMQIFPCVGFISLCSRFVNLFFIFSLKKNQKKNHAKTAYPRSTPPPPPPPQFVEGCQRFLGCKSIEVIRKKREKTHRKSSSRRKNAMAMRNEAQLTTKHACWNNLNEESFW